jgi:hypothetical protein
MAKNTRFTLFLKKWAKIYLKADMSQWSDVFNALDGEYADRARKDAKFRLEYENSDELLSDLMMKWVNYYMNK